VDGSPAVDLSLGPDRLLFDMLRRYLATVLDLLSSVDQMEDALKKRKQRAKATQASASASSGPGGLSDSEKIKLQLLLDAAAFGADLDGVAGTSGPPLVEGRSKSRAYVPDVKTSCGSAGVSLAECQAYRDLLRAVAPASQYVGEDKLEAIIAADIRALLVIGPDEAERRGSDV
jgi:hypothetical protein